MKFRIFVLALLVALGVVPAFAQENSRSTVTFNGFTFSFDSALATSVNITQFAGDPPDLQQPGGPEVKHTQFNLYNAAPAPESLFDALGGIRVYKTADFAGYEFPQMRLTQLQQLLADHTDLAPYMVVPPNDTAPAELPFMPVMPAGQIIRAQAKYMETAGFKGISYLTVYRQDVSPFLSDSFWYTFQGISKDGAYYVMAVFKLNTALFPAELGADFDYNAFSATYHDYLVKSVDTLNSASATDFTPSLDGLDKVVQTFAMSQ